MRTLRESSLVKTLGEALAFSGIKWLMKKRKIMRHVEGH